MSERVVIAGATGFLGRPLAKRLVSESGLEVVGLTRGEPHTGPGGIPLLGADLFSLKDAEAGLAGARYAIYLVHSMARSARLVQGSFEDLDLIAADNFGRAAKTAGVEQIVYVGGLRPRGPEPLSKHLASREEVARALAFHDVPVTELRAGLIVGSGGSSFEMILRLVRRLPVLVCPGWTENRCQPIDLATLIELVVAVLGKPEHYGTAYDLGGPDILSYRAMLEEAATELALQRRFVPVPIRSPALSRLWVSAITGAPKELVSPLIDSLRHDLVASETSLQRALGLPGLPYREAVRATVRHEQQEEPQAYRPAPLAPLRGVRSVQRIPLPVEADAEWAADEYMRWLPRGLWPLMRVRLERDGDKRSASFVMLGITLLVLVLEPSRSSKDRQLFYIRGGVLAATSQGRGRLEFREVPDRHALLTAIHEFMPRLPWLLYRWTQAIVHAIVMWAFGRHLARLAARPHLPLPGDAARHGEPAKSSTK